MSKELENVVAGSASEGCCGGPAPTGVDACCVADANAIADGDDRCGCSTPSVESKKKGTSSCC